MTRQEEKTTALPGLLPTVAAGLDVVTRHLWLVILPIVLDIFYWIGPQLRSTQLWLTFADFFRQAGAMTEMADQLTQIAGHTNLFTFLSVPFLGVPGLLSGIIMPEQTPLQPPVWEVGDFGSLILLFAVISFGGLLVSAIFHAFLARAVCQQRPQPCQMVTAPGQSPWISVVRRLPVYCLRVLGLALLLLFILMALYLPLVLVASILTLLSAAVGSLVMMGGLVLLIWVIFYLSFGLHGILLRERSVFRALLDSTRFVQRNWLSALALFVMVIVVRNLLSWIWLSVDTGSWLTLFSIGGFAFVNTGLLAATFVFYRDRIELQEQGIANE